ncbi:MAG TPA: NADH-quinone oxidoreductase subunit L [Polyangia bacterium]
MLSQLRFIPLFPLLGAVYLILFGRFHSRKVVHAIACMAVGAAAMVSLDAFFRGLPSQVQAGGLTDGLGTWFASGDLRVELALRMDALSGLMCLVVTVIGTLIHIYSTGYMAHDKDYARFFAYLNLFCGAMLLLVLGDSLPVMFVGWEGVGLCSYLLIGFWYGDTANASAGKKAFITNRVGDLGFLIGMFLLFRATGTLDIPSLVDSARGSSPALTAALWWGQPVAFWAAVFLFLGAVGKSAQIPLYIWLPDAMAGPTPVSALIHAATMVTAGVYMVARLGALYLLSPAAMAIVAVVGALTALFAAVIAFGQNDFKKVLAYSTISQLGFMFVGVGTGNFSGGVFHLFTHAFFKAGLFLCAGSVMHAMAGSGDLTRMGGLGRKLPWTAWVFRVCWLAICGVPVFSGFFSKDAIIAGAFATEVFGSRLAWVGPVVGAGLMAAALGTAFYMSRLYFLVFTGTCRADAHTSEHAHESPIEMVGPLVVLALGALLAGVVALPPALAGTHGDWLGHWLAPAVGAELEISHALEWRVMAGSTVIAAAGIGLAWLFFGGGVRAPARRFTAALPRFTAAVRGKFFVDEIYGALLLRPLRALSGRIFRLVDRLLIDQMLVGGWTLLADASGRALRLIQAGDIQRYLAVFAIGLAALVYVMARPSLPSEVKIRVDGHSAMVELGDADADSGKLDYGFDFDGDGTEDRSGAKASATFSYAKPGHYTVHIRITDPRWSTARTIERPIDIR